jgi:hypothetical protein
VEDRGEVATAHLDVAALRPADDGLRLQGDDRGAVDAEEGEPPGVDVRRPRRGYTPMRSTTSSAVPRMSIGYPPPRSACACSTTVTVNPYRRSQ